MLKFTATQLQSLGCKSHEEAADKIVALFSGLGDLTSQTKTISGLTGEVKTVSELTGKIKADVEGVTDRIGKLEARPAQSVLTDANVREIATTVAASKVTEIAAQMGVTPPAPAAAKKEEVNGAANIEALVKAGKYEDAYALDKDAQEEFGNVKVYAAYMRHRHQVKNADKKK